MSLPVVSVIIPTYNRAHLVRRAIHSVLAQTFTDFELIIVDDASPDNTRDVIASFQDARIRYTPLIKNSGLSIARNSGIAVAQGAYIAFLDDDDEWLPEKLSKQVQAFETKDPQVGACYTWIKSVHETNQREQIIAPTYEGFIFEDLLYSCFANVSSLMVKAECLQKLGAFDSTFRGCEDWDLLLRLAREYQFAVVPEVLSIYWNHDSSDRLTNKYSFMLDAYLNLLKKHPTMQDLSHQFRTLGSDSLKKKSEYLFERGKRYMRWGLAASHTEGIKLAKSYLKAAFLANPKNLSTLSHYLVSSYLEKQYLFFVQLENRLRRQKYNLIQRSRTLFSRTIVSRDLN